MKSLIVGKDFQILSRLEELDAWQRMQDGDPAGRDALIESQLAWVLNIAKRLSSPNDSLEDVYQVGVLGLIECLDGYDAQQTRLSTYCSRPVFWRIRSYLSKARATLSRPYNRNERYAEAWDRAGLNSAELTREREPIFEQTPEHAEELARLQVAIEQLPNRERCIVRARLNGETLEAIGRRLAFSKERIRQLEARAHEMLRAAL